MLCISNLFLVTYIFYKNGRLHSTLIHEKLPNLHFQYTILFQSMIVNTKRMV